MKKQNRKGGLKNDSNNYHVNYLFNRFITFGNVKRWQKMIWQERDQMTAEDQKIFDLLKGKSRSEQDEILFELERTFKNGNTLRINNTGNGVV